MTRGRRAQDTRRINGANGRFENLVRVVAKPGDCVGQ
jgi:hypothetical protein